MDGVAISDISSHVKYIHYCVYPASCTKAGKVNECNGVNLGENDYS